jgi:hypothetical protein
MTPPVAAVNIGTGLVRPLELERDLQMSHGTAVNCKDRL